MNRLARAPSAVPSILTSVLTSVLAPVPASVSALLVAAAALSLAGCADDSMDGPDEQDEATCKVRGDYATLGAVTGTASTNGAGDPLIAITLDAGPPRDVLQVKLTAGAGAFAGGLKTGTFTIGGADAGFTTCGLCLTIVADIVAGQGPTKFFHATGGQVMITSTTRPYAGSITNLALGEITIDGTPVPGCKTAVASASFTSN